jgi:hypothetical protein
MLGINNFLRHFQIHKLMFYNTFEHYRYYLSKNLLRGKSIQNIYSVNPLKQVMCCILYISRCAPMGLHEGLPKLPAGIIVRLYYEIRPLQAVGGAHKGPSVQYCMYCVDTGQSWLRSQVRSQGRSRGQNRLHIWVWPQLRH